MKKLKIIVFFSLLIFSFCTGSELKLNDKEIVFTNKSFGEIEKLNFTKLNNYLGYPSSLYIYDSVILIEEIGGEYEIGIYSKKNGNFIKSELKIGKGPNEVVGSFGIGVLDKNTFWSYEGETKKIRFFNIKDILNKNINAPIIKEISLNLKRFPYHVIPISLNKYAVTGSPEFKSKVTFIDSIGSQLDSLGKFSNLDFPDLTFLKGAYSYHLAIKPNKEKIALAYYSTDVIEIYDKSGKIIAAIHGPDHYDVSPKPNNKNMRNYFVRSKKTKEAYISIKATDKYIYALYDGTTANKPTPIGKWINIFDWNGNPVKILELSDSFYAFDVDEINKRIYAVSIATGNLIYADFNIN